MAIGINHHPEESRFVKLKPAASGGPFALVSEYQQDLNPSKVDLIIGAYRDDDHEYLPLRGSPEFLQAAQILVFGPKIMRKDAKSIASIQTVSGTGPNSLIAAFLQRHTQPTNIWLPDPTWMNHVDVWKETAPAVSVKRYPYYDNATKTFNFDGMIRELANKAQANDAILLHACAHNPTGIDPSKEQWREIAQLCKTKKIFIIFDIAYQGFASGDLDLDAWAIRYFCTYPEIEMVVCQSFSKNLGLYGERTGALHITISRESSITPTAAVENHLIDLHRAIASMAPRFGCRIATEILQNEELRKTWSTDLLTMSGRIKDMRRALYEELARLGTPGNWKHIVEQTGMFSYTGLGPDEVATLKKEYHVYLLPSGRASICGLTSSIVQYTAEAIHKVVSRKLL